MTLLRSPPNLYILGWLVHVECDDDDNCEVNKEIFHYLGWTGREVKPIRRSDEENELVCRQPEDQI